MQYNSIPIWKSSPFCRIIIPLIAGIICQWYLQFAIAAIITSLISCFAAFIFFYFLPLEIRFRLQFIQGILLVLLLFYFALFISWQKDTRHHDNWYGHKYKDKSLLLVRINEPLTEKANSLKAEVLVERLQSGQQLIPVKGKLFAYFSKDSFVRSLKYGDRLLIKARLQRIRNSGNPGAFNYERYGAFQQVFYTAYVSSKNMVLLGKNDVNTVYKFIFWLREHVVNILKKNIPGGKNISGIAEALLIGYKDDLDRDLVQAYSNAGVVHIIAISGLHLGLIYILLAWIFDRLPVIRKQKTVKVVLLIACLWIFSLLTGASASVLRSAVMFTCILIGKNYFKQSSIYNALAASAFILLCYDPYLLWDVGFQLSYLAIIGIVVLQKPIINLAYFKNKWLNKIWNMLAVTIAAQVITFPVCIYYFHQFPNLFFITNLVAVPLSTLILFIEILLIAFSWIPFVGICIGKLAAGLIWVMNFSIDSCNRIPYSLLDNIYANLFTTWSLYFLIAGIAGWLLNKNKLYFKIALLGMLGFVASHVYIKLKVNDQKKIIIYHVPQRRAIDFIYRHNYFFAGNAEMNTEGYLRNFHLKPARISFQANEPVAKLTGLKGSGNIWQFFGKKMIIADSPFRFPAIVQPVKVDILLISGNPSLEIAVLTRTIKPSVIVFDASNSLWKIAIWKKECLALALHCFSVSEEGAFIFDID